MCVYVYRVVKKHRRPYLYGSFSTKEPYDLTCVMIKLTAGLRRVMTAVLPQVPWVSTPMVALQHTATHCNTLQHTAIHCYTLQHTATQIPWVSTPTVTLQHTAAHGNTLQHTTTHGNTSLVGLYTYGNTIPTQCNTMQHNATHCSTLQHTATHCNILQHTVTHCSTRHTRTRTHTHTT